MSHMRLILLVGLVAIAAGSSGCFQPKYTDGSLQCSPAGECPRGLTCIEGRCYKGTPAPDLGGGADMSDEQPDMTSTLPMCVIGTSKFGDACRFGP